MNDDSNTLSEIPKIIHQIWIGPRPAPIKWIQSWLNYIKKYPNYQYKLWTQPELEKFPMINKHLYQREIKPYAKADIARYEILYKYGGIYIDADIIWLGDKSFDTLLEESQSTGFFAGMGSKVYLGNSLFGCSMGSPHIKAVIDRVKSTYRNNLRNKVWKRTGPKQFSKALIKRNITIFPKQYFYPKSWQKNNIHLSIQQIKMKSPNSYTFHYGMSTNNLNVF